MFITKHATSLGVKEGKTVVMKTGLLTTTATTADQVVLTYTVTTNKTFYIEYLILDIIFSTPSGTATFLGRISLELPSGTKVITMPAQNANSSGDQHMIIPFCEPIPATTGQVVRIVCTPAVTTSIDWYGNFGGYEI